MKLALAALVVACLSFGADATAVRGKTDAAEPVVRMLDGDDDEESEVVVGAVTPNVTPKLSIEDVGADHYYKPYKTGSCTCAAEAYLDVYKEGGAHLKMFPLVLATNPDGTVQDDAATTSIFPKVQREINRLLDFAVCFLHSIDCGCDDGPHNGNLPVKHFGNFAVSTYQCCCDVNAIRDLINNGIKELSQWETTMGSVYIEGMKVEMATIVNQGLIHKRKQFHVLENIVQNVYKNVLEIGDIYTEHGEDCLDAICADDSAFEPTFPVLGDQYECTSAEVGAVEVDWYTPHHTSPPPGTPPTEPPVTAPVTCVRVCDAKGKSQCVNNFSGGNSCSTTGKCAGDGEVCIEEKCKDLCNRSGR